MIGHVKSRAASLLQNLNFKHELTRIDPQHTTTNWAGGRSCLARRYILIVLLGKGGHALHALASKLSISFRAKQHVIISPEIADL
jgi:hypothetical protein